MNDIGARVERLRGFLSQDPENIALLVELADALIAHGSAAEAKQYVERAMNIAPDSHALTYRKAVALRRLGDREAARTLLGQMVGKADCPPAVRYELADLSFSERDFDACIAGLAELTQQERDDLGTANLLLVRALHHKGSVDDAIAVAEGSLASNPEQAALTGALATLYLDAERFEDAERLISAAHERGYSLPELLCVSGYLAMVKDDTATAAANFEEVLRSRPRDGRSLLGAGLATAAEGQIAKSVELLQQAADAMPTHLGTLNALAWMQLMTGRLEDASETLKRAQQIDDAFSETYGAQAVVAALRGQAGEARGLIRTALRLDRDCFGAAYAEMLLLHGNDSAALQSSSLEFLARQAAPGGDTLKDAVLRLGRRAQRFSSGGGRPN